MKKNVFVSFITVTYTTICQMSRGAKGGEFECAGLVQGVESCKIVFIWGHFLFTCSDFCCRMYHLATMHSATVRKMDWQTDERQYHAMMPIADG